MVAGSSLRAPRHANATYAVYTDKFLFSTRYPPLRIDGKFGSIPHISCYCPPATTEKTNKVDTSWGYKKCLTRPFLAGGPHYGDSTTPRGTQRGTGLLFKTYQWWEGDIGGTWGTPWSFGVQVIGVDGAWGTQGLFGVQLIGVEGAGGTPGLFGVQVSGVDGKWGTPGTFGVQVSGVGGTWGTPQSFGVQVSGVGGVQGTPGPFGVPVSGLGGPRGIRVDTPSTGAQQSLLQCTDGVKINELCSDHNAYLDTSPVSLGYWATLQVAYGALLHDLIYPKTMCLGLYQGTVVHGVQGTLSLARGTGYCCSLRPTGPQESLSQYNRAIDHVLKLPTNSPEIWHQGDHIEGNKQWE
ncbi:hypothetical protein C8F04DRAFT_1178876 [Mycena alexandri]|uniref:Uncharacterized protein n=1 Tax=Mycena alexandri TaxID=1745969 RepID=A0AAD6T4K8_9AGAR|nr:hypothetical protein C8F04DRAFT_1178876 [Mycena alexandri]